MSASTTRAYAQISGHRGVPVYVPHLMGCDLAGGNWAVYSEIIEFFVPWATVVRLPR